jgi:hypothetical protein
MPCLFTVSARRGQALKGEKRSSRDEIGGFEPLGESAVDRPKQLARLVHSLLSAPEPGEAHRGA